MSGAGLVQVVNLPIGGFVAVEFRTVPTQCNFVPMLDPDAPALCEGFGSVQSIASEDFEVALYRPVGLSTRMT